MVDHTLLDVIGHNLTAPMPLFFALGILATLIRSELKVPDALSIGLTLYLLGAIGLHGGLKFVKWESSRSGCPSPPVLCSAL